MSATTQRPTPETDEAEINLGSACGQFSEWYVKPDFARKFERERDEAREQLEAMREAIREVYRVLDNALFVHQAITTYAPQDAVDKIENQKHCDNMKTALAKLQLFLKT